MKSTVEKVISSLVLFSMVVIQVPAQAISDSLEQGKVRLERYLSKAELERSTKDWKRLAEEGLQTAMLAWENSETVEKEFAENYYREILDKRFIEWQTSQEYEEKISFSLTSLKNELKKAANTFSYTNTSGDDGRKINQDEVSSAKAAWNIKSNEIIEKYINRWEEENKLSNMELRYRNEGLKFTDTEINSIRSTLQTNFTSRIREEFEDIKKAETNDLLRIMLYDQYSLKKQSDSEAAAAIVKQLVSETKLDTNKNISELFADMNTVINSQDEDLSIREGEWIDRFDKVMKDAVEKWNKAEQDFLASRAKWMAEAENVYNRDDEAWTLAYQELEKERQIWTKDLTEQIKKAENEWEAKKKNLESQIKESLAEYETMLLNESSLKEKTVRVQSSIYDQNRQLVNIGTDAINSWYELWGEKYKGVYSYWKTEDQTSLQLGSVRSFQNSTDIEKVKSQITDWKKNYLKMIEDVVNGYYNNLNTQYTNLNTDINNLTKSIDNYQSEKDELTNTNSQLSTEKQERVSFLQTEIEKLSRERSEKQSELGDVAQELSKIQTLKNEIFPELKDTEGYKTSLTRDGVSGIVKRIKDAFIPYDPMTADSRIVALWEESNLFWGHEEDIESWFTTINTGIEESRKAIVELYKLTGNVFTGESITELGSEILKAQALVDYWQEEFDVLSKCVDYIKDDTSKVDSLQETNEKLKKANADYEKALKEYNDEIEALKAIENIISGKEEIKKETKLGNLVDQINKKYKDTENYVEIEYGESIQKRLDEINNKMQEDLAAIEAAQKAYTSCITSSTSTKGIKYYEESISQIIAKIKENETSKNNESLKKQLNDYYSALVELDNLNIVRNKLLVLNSIDENGFEGIPIAELEEMVSFDTEKLFGKESILQVAKFEKRIKKDLPQENQLYEKYKAILDDEKKSEPEKEKARILLKQTAEYVKSIYAEKKLKLEAVKELLSTEKIENETEVNAQEIKEKELKSLLEANKNALDAFGLKETDTYKSIYELFETIFDEENEDFIASVEANRNDSMLKNILNGSGIFEDQYISDWVSMENEKLLKTYGVNLSDVYNSVHAEYDGYSVKKINENIETAENEIRNIINDTSKSTEDLIVEIQEFRDGLTVSGQRALQNYINEKIKEEVRKTSVEDKKTTDAEYEALGNRINDLASYSNGINVLRSLNKDYINEEQKTLEDFLNSDIFKAIEDENIQKAFYEHAAYLILLRSNPACFEGNSREEYIEKYVTINEGLYSEIEDKEVRKKIADIVYATYTETYQDISAEQKSMLGEIDGQKFVLPTENLSDVDEIIRLTEEKNEKLDECELNKEQNFLESFFESESLLMQLILKENTRDDFDALLNKKKKSLEDNAGYDFFEIIKAKFYAEENKKLNTLHSIIISEIQELNTLLENQRDNNVQQETGGKQNSENNEEADKVILKEVVLESGINFLNAALEEDLQKWKAKVISDYEQASKEVNEVIFSRFDEAMMNKDWYSYYVAGADENYVFLNLNTQLIDEVVEYENEKKNYSEQQALFSELVDFRRIENYLGSYSVYLDGPLSDWCQKTEVSDEDKEILEGILVQGKSFAPKVYTKELRESLPASQYLGYLIEETNPVISDFFIKKNKEANKEIFRATYKDSLYEEIKNIEAENTQIKKKGNVKYVNDEVQEKITEAETAGKNPSEFVKFDTSVIASLNNGGINRQEVSSTFASYFTELNNKYYMSDIFENYSETKKVSDVSIDISLKQMEISSIAENLNTYDQMRKIYIENIGSLFDELKTSIGDISDKQTELNTKKNNYENAKQTYDQDKAVYQRILNQYETVCKEYNVQLDAVKTEFIDYEKSRKELRVAQEIEDWAKSTYLHVDGDEKSAGYETPKDRKEKAENALDSAKEALEILNNIKNTKYTLIGCDDEYTKYETAENEYFLAKKLNYEIDQVLSSQKMAVAEAQNAVNVAKNAIISLVESSVVIDIDDSSEGLVKVTSSGNETQKSYSFGLTGKVTKNYHEEHETIYENGQPHDIVRTWVTYDFENSGNAGSVLGNYLNENNKTEKNVYGDDVVTKNAQEEALAWLDAKRQEEDNYLQKVILAANYLKIKQNEEAKQNEETDFISDFVKVNPDLDWAGFKNGSNPYADRIHNVDLKGTYTDSFEKELFNIYQSVKEEDIAKYLIYSDQNSFIKSSLNLEAEAVKHLKTIIYNDMIAEAEREYDVKNGVAIAAGVSAAAALAVAIAIPALLGFGIPKAIAFVAAAALAVTAGVKVAEANKVRDLIDEQLAKSKITENNFITDTNEKIKQLFDNLTSAQDKLNTENEKLNQMMYGTATAPKEGVEMSADAIKKELEKALSGNTIVSYEEVKEFLDGKVVVDGKEKLIISGATSLADAVGKILLEKRKARNVANDALLGEYGKAEDLLKTQSKNSDSFYEKLNEITASGKAMTDDEKKKLEEFAGAAWGDNTFKNSDLTKKLRELFGNEIISETKTEDGKTEVNALNNVRFERSAESYITEAENNLIEVYITDMERKKNILMEQKIFEYELLRTNLNSQYDAWWNQVNQIQNVANKEWNKAEEKLITAYNEWHDSFEKEYADKLAEWEANYRAFRETEEIWFYEQNMKAVTETGYEQLLNSGLDADAIVKEALINATSVAEMETKSIVSKENMNQYLSSLYDTSLLNNLSSYMSSLATRGKTGAIQIQSGMKKTTDQNKAYMDALLKMGEKQKELNDKAVKYAKEEAEKTIQKTIDAFLERIKQENESMDEWEASMMSSDGYEKKGNAYVREAIVDSTMFTTVRKNQSVSLYKWYNVQKSEIDTYIESGNDADDELMSVLKKNELLTKWGEETFGTEMKEDDGNDSPDKKKEPVYTINRKVNYIDRETGAELKIKDDVQTASVRSGKLGEHIGYAPVFKQNNLDYDKSWDANIAANGAGEMHTIMGEYIWNSMIEGKGQMEFSKAVYDQKLWEDNGSFFTPPTLRDVVSVACEIVGNATGQKWISYADDALFAGLDLTGGYKTAEEIGLELAKKAATAALSAGVNAAGSALSSSVSALMDGAGKGWDFLAQSTISMTQSYVTTVGNSAINSVYIKSDGTLDFNKEGFVDSLHSAGTISSVVGAGITGGLNGVYATDSNGIALNSKTFNTNGIHAMTGLAGGLATNAVSLAMGGDATFNLASAYGVGFLEFSIGKNGVHSTIGMGGTNISYQNLKAAYGGLSEAKKVSDWKYDLGEEQKRTLNAINMLGYTNAGNNQQLAGEIWNGTKNVEYRNLDGEYGHFNASEDPNKVILSDALLGKGKEASAMLATVMSHEGTHVYGNRVEGVAHLAGLQTYSQLGEMFKLKGNKSFTESMEKALYDENSWKENTGDVDYWILMNDGTLVNDGTGWLVDESGLYVNIDGTRSNKPKKGKTLGAGKLDEKGNAIQGSIETGLLNILANSSGKIYDSFSDTEKLYSYSILKCSGFENDDPEMQKALRDINWTEKENKPINMDLVMRFAGDTIATAVFMNYFDKTTNSMIDGNTSISAIISEYKDSGYLNRLTKYYSAKKEFYGGEHKMFDSDDLSRMKIKNGYGPDSSYNDGYHKGPDFTSIKQRDVSGLESYIDFSKEEVELYSFYGGKVVYDYDQKIGDTAGYSVIIEHGFNFEGSFYSTGVMSQYMHMKDVPSVKKGDYISKNTYLGNMGRTGWSTGEHLHWQLMGNLAVDKSNIGAKDPKWGILQNRREYFLNQLGMTTENAHYAGSGKKADGTEWSYMNYYYDTNPVWQRMGLKMYK